MTMKLNFSVDMKGAEDIERTLNRLAQKLNETGGAADHMAKEIGGDMGRLGDYVNKMVSQGHGLDKLVEGMGDAGKAIQRNFSTSLEIVSKTLRSSIERMQKDIQSLTGSIVSEQEKLENLKKGGDTKDIIETENRIVSMQSKQTAMLSQVNATKQALGGAESLLTPAKPGVGGVGGLSKSLMEGGVEGLAMKLGIGGAALYGGYKVAQYAVAQPEIAYRQELLKQDTFISEMNRQSRLRTGAMSGNVLGFEMEQRGLGYVKEFEQDKTKEAVDAKMYVVVESVKNAITSGFGLLGVWKGSENITQDVKTELQSRVDSLLAPFESMASTVKDIHLMQGAVTREFGQEGGAKAVNAMMASGLDAETAVRGMSPFTRHGVVAGKGDLTTIVANLFGGFSDKMSEEAAKLNVRQLARGGQQDTTGFTNAIKVAIKEAGLGGAGSLEMRKYFTDMLGVEMEKRIFQTTEQAVNATELSRRIATNVNTAAMAVSPTGKSILSPVETVEMSRGISNTIQSMQENPMTALGMIDTLTMMEAGIVAPSAQAYYRSAGLDNPDTVRNMLRGKLKREPSQDEIASFMQRRQKAREPLGGMLRQVHGLEGMESGESAAILTWTMTQNLKEADLSRTTNKDILALAQPSRIDLSKVPESISRGPGPGYYEPVGIKEGKVDYQTKADQISHQATVNSQMLAVEKVTALGVDVVSNLLESTKKLTSAMDEAFRKIESAMKLNETMGTQSGKQMMHWRPGAGGGDFVFVPEPAKPILGPVKAPGTK